MHNVRNAWYVAFWEEDIPDDRPLGTMILGEAIAIWKSDGKLVAFEDRCPHRSAPLSLGRCEGGHLRCMYHGLLFDRQGWCVQVPGQDLIPPKAFARTYPVVAMHSWIWVWMGNPAKADEALIPPAIGFGNDYIFGRGELAYEAEARLINDNLLDFSHLTYVHAESFGAGSVFADEVPKLETLARGVRYSRWVPDTKGPAGRTSDDLVDNFMTYDFLIPGVLLMWNGSFSKGTAKRLEFGTPDFREAIGGVTFTNQAVTPTNDRAARYLFSWGPHRDHGDESLRDFLMDLAARAFMEDKIMIEAQQRVLDRHGNPPVVPTAHDRGVTIFNRLVEKLSRDESPALTAAERIRANA